jgi:hypothetical protein
MANEKELEWEYGQMMVRKNMENFILITDMGAERWKRQVVTVIGGNTRMVTRKDMEHSRGLMETDTSGNGWMIRFTGMEYTDGLMEEYIMDSGNRIWKMAKDIKVGQVAMSIGESTRMTRNGETESYNMRENYTMSNTNKTSLSAKVKYHDVLQKMSRNY